MRAAKLFLDGYSVTEARGWGDAAAKTLNNGDPWHAAGLAGPAPHCLGGVGDSGKAQKMKG